MDERVIIGVALLFGVSVIVRIVPAFVPFRFSARTQYNIKNILPVAIFVNLMVYCATSEIANDAVPAVAALAALLALFKPLGLLLSIVAATAVYVVLGQA